ncbi:MAG TPA: hypothetical protein VED41_03905 [Solirubrobacteraceae bacterium]|nr:hypothetical protein [Solirubrobacteraceae bacterium]
MAAPTAGRADAAEVVVLHASVVTKEEASEARAVRVDGLPLEWAGYKTPSRTQLDLSPGLPRRIEVARVVKSRQGPRTPPELQVYFKAYNRANHIESGRVTFILAATSSNWLPSYHELVLDYDGTWPDGEPVWDHLQVVSLKRLFQWQVHRRSQTGRTAERPLAT